MHTYTQVYKHWVVHTQTDNQHTHMQRQQRLSRLVAVLPPPGMINVSSHLVNPWPYALAEDGWRSKDWKRKRDCVLGLKLAMILPPRFCKDMQCANTHVCTQQTLRHTRTCFSLSSLPPSICWPGPLVLKTIFADGVDNVFFTAQCGE